MKQRKKKPSALRRLLWPLLFTLITITASLSLPQIVSVFSHGESPLALGETLRVLVGGASYFSSAWLAGRLVGLAIERAGNGRRRPPRLLLELVSAGLFLAATVATIMLAVGQSMAGALAGSGIIVAILGFALRNVIADVFSGVALGLEGSYRIGDWVEIENLATGRVLEVGWRTTRLHTRDQTYVIVPNSLISRERLVNYSAPSPRYRAKLRVTLDHAISVADAKALMEEAAAGADGILTKPEPDVRVIDYDSTGITYVVRYWVPNFADDVDCRDAVLAAIDAALRARGMPSPRRRVVSEQAEAYAQAETSAPRAARHGRKLSVVDG